MSYSFLDSLRSDVLFFVRDYFESYVKPVELHLISRRCNRRLQKLLKVNGEAADSLSIEGLVRSVPELEVRRKRSGGLLVVDRLLLLGYMRRIENVREAELSQAILDFWTKAGAEAVPLMVAAVVDDYVHWKNEDLLKGESVTGVSTVAGKAAPGLEVSPHSGENSTEV